MPLRIVNKNRTHTVTVCDTVFHLISMSIREKEQLVQAIQQIDGDTDDPWGVLMDQLCAAIVRIDGYDTSPREVLAQLEDVGDLRAIMRAVIEYCSLTPSELKNSHSSSEQPTPESAGNATSSVDPDDEPVSTTRTQKDTSQ